MSENQSKTIEFWFRSIKSKSNFDLNDNRLVNINTLMKHYGSS